MAAFSATHAALGTPRHEASWLLAMSSRAPNARLRIDPKADDGSSPFRLSTVAKHFTAVHAFSAPPAVSDRNISDRRS
jgi:hypothetical protein